MFSGVMALLERSLRVDSRAWAPHIARFGLMAAIYIAVCYTTSTSLWFGAPGLRFFQSIVMLNLTFMTLTGIGYFSTAITEEKEEDTLGLMLMAGISPLGILLGKSVGTLVQAVLLIAVQYPFTLLAVTMGGVTQSQVRAVYLSLIAYMVLLSGLGLLCSVLSARNRSSAFRMTLALFAYFAIPYCCERTSGPAVFVAYPNELYTWVRGSSVFIELRDILSSDSPDRLISRQVITNLALGAIAFLLAWASFDISAQAPTSDSVSRGLVPRRKGLVRIFSPGRVRLDPLFWKDFHFVSGGFAAALLRLAFYIALYFVIVVGVESNLFNLGWGPTGWEKATGSYFTVLMFAISFDAGLLLSRSLHDEIKEQTLSALMMLPISTGRVLYPKAAGSLLPWLPGLACLVFGIFVLPGGLNCAGEFFRRAGPPYLFISFFVLAPHIAALSALYVRWGALPVGIGITIALAMLMAFIIGIFRIGPEDTSVFVLATGVVALCCACHIAIWLRAEALSAR